MALENLAKPRVRQTLRTIFPLGFWPSGKIHERTTSPFQILGEIKNANMFGRENRGHHPVTI